MTHEDDKLPGQINELHQMLKGCNTKADVHEALQAAYLSGLLAKPPVWETTGVVSLQFTAEPEPIKASVFVRTAADK